MSDLTLEDLPTHILQSICQILVRSRNFNSVLCVRSVSKNIYELINGFTLLLSMQIGCNYALKSETVSDYVDYVTENTSWRLENLEILVYYSQQGCQKWKPQSMLKYLKSKRRFFRDHLRVLTLQPSSDSKNVYYCNKIARIVCNDRTKIILDNFCSRVSEDEFLLCDRVSSFETYIETELTPKCILWKFANLEKLSVVRFDEHLDIRKNFKFGNLKELRVYFIQPLFHLVETYAEAFFPNVKYLRFNDYEQNDNRLGALLWIHFPLLEHLEVSGGHECLEDNLQMESMYDYRERNASAEGSYKVIPRNGFIL